MSMYSDCHGIEPGSLRFAVRVHVWYPVDPGLSPDGVTTLSLRYKWCQKWDGLLEVIGGVPVKLCEGPPGRLTPV